MSPGNPTPNFHSTRRLSVVNRRIDRPFWPEAFRGLFVYNGLFWPKTAEILKLAKLSEDINKLELSLTSTIM